MADEKLIFPIGFDLEEGVKQAGREWKNHYRKRLQDAIDSRPLKVKIDFESKGIDTKEFKQWMVLSREAERLERERIKNAKEWQKVADQAAMAETRRANATNESNARIERANRKAEASEQRKAKAVRETNNAYNSQSTYLSRLIQRMGIYFGLHQAANFIRNIRDVTMQFELQRVALGSIIGDMNEANKMFEQIKAAAVKSPFEIKDLVSYTKQLAAYKIEQDELFETTQRLADVSAGLGVGMERLVLAYGQIRATGYLRASEVRQLTEAGIPIVEELAKKMSQLRGETVSAAEVMGLISERAISFGMVKEVFEDMTSAGGMFYKMQEKQAETLAGQWSNLKDSFSIMYEEMGNTEIVNSAMKGMIGLIKSLAENWRDVSAVVSSLSVSIGTYYAVMKNATIASKALSVAEATRLSTLRATTVYMPKFLASTKLATTLTHAYRVAVIKSATATGILSKAFWGLTKAMLSNPYTAVLAALAGLATLLLTTESRAKRLSKELAKIGEDGAIQIDQSARNFERLAKAIRESEDGSEKQTVALAELKRSYGELLPEQDKEIKALVQEKSNYDSLIKSIKRKIELQIQEQKLNKIASEYGSRISTAEDDFKGLLTQYGLTEEDADRVTDATKKAIEEGLISAQKSAKENARELSRILEEETGLTKLMDYFDPMNIFTERYGRKMRNQFGSLVEVVSEYNTEIDKVGGALDKLDDKAKDLSDTFNTWQKELEAINEGTNDLGDNIRIFDDTTISQITKITDATSRVADEYKRLAKEKERVDKALLSEGAKADSKTYAKLEKRLGRINMAMSMLYNFLEKYGGLDLLEEGRSGGGKKANPRIALLNEELSTVEKIYKEYQELRKFMREDDARARIADMFEGVNLTMLSQALSPTEMRAQLQKALDEAKKMGDKKQILEFEYKLGKFDVDEEQRKLEKSLKDLSDKISRTKTAKEFFDRMLGMTGDKQLTATLTMSVYGTTGDDLQRLMSKQVEEAFKNLPEGFDITKAMLGGGKFDYNLLESWIEKLPEQDRKSAQSIVENWRKTNQDIITDLYKTYEEFLSFEERKTKVVEKENAERMRIINSGLPMAEQEKLIGASQKRENKALADIAIEEFKASADWAKSFEDLEHLATPTIERLMAKLKEFIDTQKDLTPEQLKTLTNEYKKLYDGLIARNPFKAMTDGIKEYVAATKDVKTAKDRVETAQKELRIATERKAAAEQNFKTSQDVATAGREYANAIKEYNKASQNAKDADKDLGDALDNQKKALNKTVQGFNEASSAISNFGSIITDITEILGIAEDSEVGAFIKDLVKWLGVMASVLGTVAAIIAVIEAELAPLLAIAAGIAAIGAAISFFSNAKVRRANEEIERQQKLLDALAYSYERLEKAQEKAFGSDYISNYEQRMANLEAQQAAYIAQAEAERSKGKKADADKIKEYEEQARATADEIKDMQSELSEYFLGTDLTSAARDFANAWIDAYKEFGNTTDAMKEKFQDMIQNMIVESFAARVIATALEPIFTEIDDWVNSGFDMGKLAEIANMTNATIGNIDVGMTNLMNALSQAGISVRGMGSDLTGISKDIATASEESILGLAAGINTQNFYISQVPPKLDVIIGLLQGGNPMQGSAITLQDLVTLQNQHLSYLPSIAHHTAETVAECKMIVVETRRTADVLERVIKPRGVTSTHTLNTTIGS